MKYETNITGAGHCHSWNHQTYRCLSSIYTRTLTKACGDGDVVFFLRYGVIFYDNVSNEDATRSFHRIS